MIRIGHSGAGLFEGKAEPALPGDQAQKPSLLVVLALQVTDIGGNGNELLVQKTDHTRIGKVSARPTTPVFHTHPSGCPFIAQMNNGFSSSAAC